MASLFRHNEAIQESMKDQLSGLVIFRCWLVDCREWTCSLRWLDDTGDLVPFAYLGSYPTLTSNSSNDYN